MNEDSHHSFVEYMSDHSGYKCGYCNSKDTNFSHGMWAFEMAVGDYQDLIDRGWRRSGKYCYKPTMDKTCCPQYTIRCDAINFKPSKSQKKVLKRMHSFLSFGTNSDKSFEKQDSEAHQVNCEPPEHMLVDNFTSKITKSHKRDSQSEEAISAERQIPTTSNSKAEGNYKSGLGYDPTKPKCKKAKTLRLERRAAKMANVDKEVKREIVSSKCNKTSDQAKCLEDYINAPLPENPAHKLELRLLRVSFRDSNFGTSFNSSYNVYKKYQTTIHNDPPDECGKSSFTNFLVDGPLTPWNPSDKSGPPLGYGPFHQQYWLDGELIAVGVLDVLPNCISSVYLYYDPKYSFLSIGTYSSLREIALTREINRTVADLKWYYMGFYIHSCPKMRYKGNYSPSYLLCPESYEWIPIEKCLPKLEANKYSRLNDSETPEEELDLKNVSCLYNNGIVEYGDMVRVFGYQGDVETLTEYQKLVGAKASASLVLIQQK